MSRSTTADLPALLRALDRAEDLAQEDLRAVVEEEALRLLQAVSPHHPPERLRQAWGAKASGVPPLADSSQSLAVVSPSPWWKTWRRAKPPTHRSPPPVAQHTWRVSKAGVSLILGLVWEGLPTTPCRGDLKQVILRSQAQPRHRAHAIHGTVVQDRVWVPGSRMVGMVEPGISLPRGSVSAAAWVAHVVQWRAQMTQNEEHVLVIEPLCEGRYGMVAIYKGMPVLDRVVDGETVLQEAEHLLGIEAFTLVTPDSTIGEALVKSKAAQHAGRCILSSLGQFLDEMPAAVDRRAPWRLRPLVRGPVWVRPPLNCRSAPPRARVPREIQIAPQSR